jgi:hypothetical protein
MEVHTEVTELHGGLTMTIATEDTGFTENKAIWFTLINRCFPRPSGLL